LIHDKITISTDDLAIYGAQTAIIIGVLKKGDKTLEELEAYTFYNKQSIARCINQHIPDIFTKTKRVKLQDSDCSKWRILTEYSYKGGQDDFFV